MTKLTSQTHHHRSIRLQGFEHSKAGADYINLCAWQRECLFGEVVAGEMWLNALGRLRQAVLKRAIEGRLF